MTFLQRYGFVGVLGAGVLLACSNKSGDEGDDTTGGATVASTTEVVPTDTGDATIDGSSSGAADVCADPSVDEVGPAVTVTLRNNGAADVFVRGGGFCGTNPYAIVDAAEMVVQTDFGSCAACVDVLANQECGCQDIGCAPAVIRIAPGGSLGRSWSGARIESLSFPAECVGEVCADSPCGVQTQAPAGAYKLVSANSKAIVCETPGCDCVPSVEGWCEIEEANLGEPELEVEAALDYPGATAVELVFE